MAGAAPRPPGRDFTPYVWAATAADVAARHGLCPAHVLRFDANLPPFPARIDVPPDAALTERGEYPEGTYAELRSAAAAYAGVSPDEIAIDAGADGLIGLVARTYLAPDRRAVVEAPTYPLYAIASRVEGAEVDPAPRDLEALARAARCAHVLWLCNPGNPTGALWSAAEIGSVAAMLPDTLVCVDEAYYEYAGETVAPRARELPNLVCIRTLSKAFALAGLRVGYSVAAKETTSSLAERRLPAPVATVAATLAAAALRRPQIASEVSATVRERERLRTALAAAGYDAPAVHANFVLVRMSDAPAVARNLERQGLVVRAYRDTIRITVRTPADDDLLLAGLGVDAPPSRLASATVRSPGVRASLVLAGSGRTRVVTGNRARDDRFTRIARDAQLDLELVADRLATDAAVGATFARALERALGS
ncbi:MAG TPA: histidinol-phosphate transaminase [Gaiellaceae bacterium]|nr:histidinol-phosphate transaminase [Gaiellaceae bacterium]